MNYVSSRSFSVVDVVNSVELPYKALCPIGDKAIDLAQNANQLNHLLKASIYPLRSFDLELFACHRYPQNCVWRRCLIDHSRNPFQQLAIFFRKLVIRCRCCLRNNKILWYILLFNIYLFFLFFASSLCDLLQNGIIS